ncbi:MAG: hypothetical protein WB424_02200 [Terracidiphilus sp.]
MYDKSNYDAAGDVTNDGINSYLYDAEGRLCAVKNSNASLTGYIYDAAGTRVAHVPILTNDLRLDGG